KQQLNMARVNVDDALRQLSIVTADLDTLQERTDELIEAATVTERLVRKALLYRDNPAVTQATQQARYYYETGYDYEQAMKTLGVMLEDRKSTRVNSSHVSISYAVFCLKKKKKKNTYKNYNK